MPTALILDPAGSAGEPDFGLPNPAVIALRRIVRQASGEPVGAFATAEDSAPLNPTIA